jgi:hypothetical protein
MHHIPTIENLMVKEINDPHQSHVESVVEYYQFRIVDDG